VIKKIKFHKKKLNLFTLRKSTRGFLIWALCAPAIVPEGQVRSLRLFLKIFKSSAGKFRKFHFFKFLTKKSKGARMGKGCGDFTEKHYFLRTNSSLFKLSSIVFDSAKYAIKKMLLRVSGPSVIRISPIVDSKT